MVPRIEKIIDSLNLAIRNQHVLSSLRFVSHAINHTNIFQECRASPLVAWFLGIEVLVALNHDRFTLRNDNRRLRENNCRQEKTKQQDEETGVIEFSNG